MEILSSAGDYFRMGYAIGISLRKKGFMPPRANLVTHRFAKDSLIEVRKLFPELIEEINGMSNALQCNYKDLLSMVLTTNVVFGDRSTAFAVGRKKPVKNLLAVNYGRHFRNSGPLLRFSSRPKNGLASIGSTDSVVGRHDGMNEAGLAIAGAGVASKSIKPGIIPSVAMRYVLDKCKNVDEAVAVLRDIKHARGFNFVIASPDKIALVEAAPGAINAQILRGGVLIAANHFGAKMRGLEHRAQRPRDTLARAAAIDAALRMARKADSAAVAEILKDHKAGVCAHGSSDYETAWSSIFIPADSRAALADGRPCTFGYKEYTIK